MPAVGAYSNALSRVSSSLPVYVRSGTSSIAREAINEDETSRNISWRPDCSKSVCVTCVFMQNVKDYKLKNPNNSRRRRILQYSIWLLGTGHFLRLKILFVKKLAHSVHLSSLN